eukprot:scaffold2497_cov119-Isochrysis_galbana.AAC.8
MLYSILGSLLPNHERALCFGHGCHTPTTRLLFSCLAMPIMLTCVSCPSDGPTDGRPTGNDHRVSCSQRGHNTTHVWVGHGWGAAPWRLPMSLGLCPRS